MEGPQVTAERERRIALWADLQANDGVLHSPASLNERRVFYGGRGIWVHQEKTKSIGNTGGVTVALLHTGSSYADDLSEDGVIYHYPRTKVPGRDAAEIEATKAAMRLNLPVFVVTYPTPNATKRRVHLGSVLDYDDDQRWFFVGFDDKPPVAEPSGASLSLPDDPPFVAVVPKLQKQHLATARAGQPRFKFLVFKRYGGRCAACGLTVQEMLEAAHIVPHQESGTNEALAWALQHATKALNASKLAAKALPIHAKALPIHSRIRPASELDFGDPHEAGMSRRVDWCVAHCSERMRNAASAMRA